MLLLRVTIPNLHSLYIRSRFRCILGGISYLFVKRVKEQPLLRTRKCERVSHVFQPLDKGVRFLVEMQGSVFDPAMYKVIVGCRLAIWTSEAIEYTRGKDNTYR